MEDTLLNLSLTCPLSLSLFHSSSLPSQKRVHISRYAASKFRDALSPSPAEDMEPAPREVTSGASVEDVHVINSLGHTTIMRSSLGFRTRHSQRGEDRMVVRSVFRSDASPARNKRSLVHQQSCLALNLHLNHLTDYSSASMCSMLCERQRQTRVNAIQCPLRHVKGGKTERAREHSTSHSLGREK